MISALGKKLIKQEQIIKMKHKYDDRIIQLNVEIQGMKQAKTSLHVKCNQKMDISIHGRFILNTHTAEGIKIYSGRSLSI
jgi:hypothetical protein